jgi:tripartite-type tricarboxylate transporter receptor subunit TctC
MGTVGEAAGDGQVTMGRPVFARARSNMRSSATLLLRTVLLLTMLAATVQAQDDWPSRPVKIVVPWPAGGSADIVGRLLGDRLGAAFKQSFVVENRAGASGMIGSAFVAGTEPDGYTLLISGIPSHVIAPAMSAAPTYDPVRDFTHVAFIGGSPIVLAVHASLGVRTFHDLIAMAQGRTEPTTYVSAGSGSLGNLLAEALAAKERIHLAHVPYRGGVPAVADLIAGHVKLGSMTWTSAQGHIRNGTLVPLAVSSTRRIAGYEQVPTFSELGHDDLTTTTWWAVSGPARLPAAIVQRLNGEIIKAIATPEVTDKLAHEAIETASMTPEQLTRFVDGEVRKWGPLTRKAAGATESR